MTVIYGETTCAVILIETPSHNEAGDISIVKSVTYIFTNNYLTITIFAIMCTEMQHLPFYNKINMLTVINYFKFLWQKYIVLPRIINSLIWYHRISPSSNSVSKATWAGCQSTTGHIHTYKCYKQYWDANYARKLASKDRNLGLNASSKGELMSLRALGWHA